MSQVHTFPMEEGAVQAVGGSSDDLLSNSVGQIYNLYYIHFFMLWYDIQSIPKDLKNTIKSDNN